VPSALFLEIGEQKELMYFIYYGVCMFINMCLVAVYIFNN